MQFFRTSYQIFLKDLRIEVRSRYGINTILALCTGGPHGSPVCP